MTPRLVVKREKIVVSTMIFAAKTALPFIALAMMYPAEAEGEDESRNKIPNSMPLNPHKYPPRVNRKGIKTSLPIVEIMAGLMSFFRALKRNDAPAHSNANGNVIRAK